MFDHTPNEKEMQSICWQAWFGEIGVVNGNQVAMLVQQQPIAVQWNTWRVREDGAAAKFSFSVNVVLDFFWKEKPTWKAKRQKKWW